MLAIVPVIILVGGLSVGAFDSTFDQDEFVLEKSELSMDAGEIASLEPFPYE